MPHSLKPSYFLLALLILWSNASLGQVYSGLKEEEENTVSPTFMLITLGQQPKPIKIPYYLVGVTPYVPLTSLSQLTEILKIEFAEEESCQIITPLGNLTLKKGQLFACWNSVIKQLLLPPLAQSGWWISLADWKRMVNWGGMGRWEGEKASDTHHWLLPQGHIWTIGTRISGDSLHIIIPFSQSIPYRWENPRRGLTHIIFTDVTVDTFLWKMSVGALPMVRVDWEIHKSRAIMILDVDTLWHFQGISPLPLHSGVLLTYLNKTMPMVLTPDTGLVSRLKAEKSRWALDRVVIDPGHGGKDPGAVGPSGAKEKEINLDVALRLANYLKSKGIEVILTREDDRFIPLKDRTQLANRSGGKLFVSLHCNASRNRKASGIETYFLSPAKHERALEVAMLENSVIELEDNPQEYKEITYENFYILALAQANFIRESQDLADMVQTSLARQTNLNDRGVDQAGFYVLVGASMPAILIEMGFITNREEEKRLKSASYRQKLAEWIGEAVIRFLHTRTAEGN